MTPLEAADAILAAKEKALGQDHRAAADYIALCVNHAAIVAQALKDSETRADAQHDRAIAAESTERVLRQQLADALRELDIAVRQLSAIDAAREEGK